VQNHLAGYYNIAFTNFFKIKICLYVVSIMAMIVSNFEANRGVDAILEMKY